MKKIISLLFLLFIAVAYSTPECSSRQYTLALIKPEAVQAKHSGNIISIIERNGFDVIAIQKKQLTKQEAEQFYAEHKDKTFFKELITYLTSGPVIAIKLAKDNAIADWRTLMGSTDPDKANVGTIRKMFGKSKTENAVHGSDSVQSAQREVAFFFKCVH